MSFSRASHVPCSLAGWAICSLFVCHVAGDGSVADGLARPQAGIAAGTRLHIVAMRDSQLLTLCPTKWFEPTPGRPLVTTPRDGDVVVTRGFGPAAGWMSVRVWQSGESATLPVPPADGAWPLDLDHGLLTSDEATASEMRGELSRAGRFSVVDSLDDAEHVLLVEARHVPLAYFAGPGGAIASHGDREGNFREALLAFLVPAPSYRAHGPNPAALLPASRWSGATLAYSPRLPSGALPRRFPASVEALARQLQGTATRPVGFPPVCAASIDRASAAGDEEIRAPTGLRDNVLVAAPPPRRGAKAAAFRGGVTYVSVPVVVRDTAGRAVAGLSASDFRLYEGDVSQPIDRLMPTSAPVTLGVVVDTSGSMRDEWSRLQTALLHFIATVQPADRVLLASFDTRVRLHAEAEAGRERVQQALGRIDSRSGTRLYDAVALLVGTRMQPIPERKALVLLTDGVDTRSRLADAESTIRLIGESHVPVYAIQYDTRRAEYALPWAFRVNGRGIRDMTPLILPEGALDNAELFARADAYLAALTEVSGGRLYRAESLLNLNQAFAQVVKDLGEQYTIGYYPTNQARDGSYRSVRVEVNRPDVTVTARAGYRAPSQ